MIKIHVMVSVAIRHPCENLRHDDVAHEGTSSSRKISPQSSSFSLRLVLARFDIRETYDVLSNSSHISSYLSFEEDREDRTLPFRRERESSKSSSPESSPLMRPASLPLSPTWTGFLLGVCLALRCERTPSQRVLRPRVSCDGPDRASCLH